MRCQVKVKCTVMVKRLDETGFKNVNGSYTCVWVNSKEEEVQGIEK